MNEYLEKMVYGKDHSDETPQAVGGYPVEQYADVSIIVHFPVGAEKTALQFTGVMRALQTALEKTAMNEYYVTDIEARMRNDEDGPCVDIKYTATKPYVSSPDGLMTKSDLFEDAHQAINEIMSLDKTKYNIVDWDIRFTFGVVLELELERERIPMPVFGKQDEKHKNDDPYRESEKIWDFIRKNRNQIELPEPKKSEPKFPGPLPPDPLPPDGPVIDYEPDLDL